MSDSRRPPQCKWDIYLFWNATWWLLTDASGQRIGALKMGPVGYTETSVTNYRCRQRNIPEEQKSENVTEYFFKKSG
jgi:hypothetical protein